MVSDDGRSIFSESLPLDFKDAMATEVYWYVPAAGSPSAGPAAGRLSSVDVPLTLAAAVPAAEPPNVGGEKNPAGRMSPELTRGAAAELWHAAQPITELPAASAPPVSAAGDCSLAMFIKSEAGCVASPAGRQGSCYAPHQRAIRLPAAKPMCLRRVVVMSHSGAALY